MPHRMRSTHTSGIARLITINPPKMRPHRLTECRATPYFKYHNARMQSYQCRHLFEEKRVWMELEVSLLCDVEKGFECMRSS